MNPADAAAWHLLGYIRQLRDQGDLDRLADHQRARIDELLEEADQAAGDESPGYGE